MNTCWAITVDHIADEDAKIGTNANAVGKIGPCKCELDYSQITGYHNRIPFKMFDDDGELYYEGFIVPGDDDRLDAPLVDFGSPNAGCTEIFIGKSEEIT